MVPATVLAVLEHLLQAWGFPRLVEVPPSSIDSQEQRKSKDTHLCKRRDTFYQRIHFLGELGQLQTLFCWGSLRLCWWAGGLRALGTRPCAGRSSGRSFCQWSRRFLRWGVLFLDSLTLGRSAALSTCWSLLASPATTRPRRRHRTIHGRYLFARPSASGRCSRCDSNEVQ